MELSRTTGVAAALAEQFKKAFAAAAAAAAGTGEISVINIDWEIRKVSL